MKKASGGNEADLRAGFNNFVGFAPGIDMNGGAAPNKNSRMYKEFGVTFEAVRMDDMQKLNDALKKRWSWLYIHNHWYLAYWNGPQAAILPKCRLYSFLKLMIHVAPMYLLLIIH